MGENRERKNVGIFSIIIKFLVNAVILVIASFLVPGFRVAGFGTAILAAIVISALDYLIGLVFKLDASPFGRGIVGFLIAAIIIYLTQFIVAGVSVTAWGAILAALVIGIIDAIVPTDVFSQVS
ncbi:MAG: phage holin family protein [Caloramator sp.]|nr:phage holin family protein [Caloramator sp.]